MFSSDDKTRGGRTQERFETTRWSMVVTAGHPSAARHRECLAELCEAYWFPLYAYLRRRGFGPHQSEDYIQAFFAWMLEKDTLGKAERKRGKFRSFLLTALKNFVANEHDRDRALKRGGPHKELSLDFADAEGQYRLEPADELTPDKLFDRSWALTILDTTIARLESESVAADKASLFSTLKVYLASKKGNIPYRDVGLELNMTEGAVKVAVHRLRRRYRQLLREVIAQTVVSEDEIDAEIRGLFAALAN